MKQVVICWVCLVGVFFFNPPVAQSHSVQGWIQSRETKVVTAEYDDGEPLGYAVFEVYTLGGKELFQSGVTDPNGCFSFLPDTPGKWKILVKDGMGHQLSLTADINNQQALKEEIAPVSGPGHLSKIGAIITGLSFIFGLTGLVLLFKTKKRPKV
ncbi:MAG: hypothetical protein KKC20_23390 [Proteobacteria bacterium]|nr:hypothetical protein [Pseudomonadota bacterium]